ncbi:hypothetical protein KCP73_03045 [Salmonella enterica subsp. enterica]|nr:hypothetical protein KCP73_03045 [Salmonella enterica subsp. enterica]
MQQPAVGAGIKFRQSGARKRLPAMTNNCPGASATVRWSARRCCQQRQRRRFLYRERRSLFASPAAYDIAALMEYGGLSLADACRARHENTGASARD